MPTGQSNQSIVSLLKGSPAFAQLSPETCEKVIGLTRERTLLPGEYLAHEGDLGDDLFLVVAGSLRLSRHPIATSDRELTNQVVQTAQIDLGTALSGDIVGELSLLTGYPRAFSMQAEQVTAQQPTIVRSLSAANFDQLCAEFPEEFTATLAWMADRIDAYQISAAIIESTLLRQLSEPARREMAASIVRVDLRAGEFLFHEGQPGDALYLILSGRLRVIAEPTPSPFHGPEARVLAELGKGDLVGELALLTGQTHSASTLAVRDSHLGRLDKAAFDRLVAAYPTELLGLFSRLLASRLREQNLEHGRGRKADGVPEGRVPVAIAVLPLNQMEQSGGGRDFASELVRQLSAFGPTLHLNRATISRIFPENRGIQTRYQQLISAQNRASIHSGLADRRLLAWLDDMELLYRHVVYEADYQTGVAESDWTSRCLRQADVLFMVAGGPADPKESERTMVRLSSKALPSVKTTLVLIHAGGPESVAYTRIWKNSLGIPAHEHIRRQNGQIHPADIGRIARKLNRQSVGVALGGGFALGLAHIGVIDAMRELDIPIDFVGGTSMGAIIAAAAAMEFTHDQMLEVMDKGCAQALKGDYTLPIVSLLTGKKVTLALGKYLERKDIEDFWLPYFAISASLVKARMVVHREGSALRSVLASCRAPGMFPPLGWDGDVLVDGGLVNNIPADVMRELVGSGTVFAADVSPDSEFLEGHAEGQFGMDLSGWKVARRNANPLRRFRKPQPHPKHATIADILMRLIRMGGVAHNQQIRNSADLYMAIALEDFSVKDFHKGEAISQAGYQQAKAQLQSWIAQNGRPWLGNVTPPKAQSPDHP